MLAQKSKEIVEKKLFFLQHLFYYSATGCPVAYLQWTAENYKPGSWHL